jgi:hypothetical protein
MHLFCLTDNFLIIWLVLLAAKFLVVKISSICNPLLLCSSFVKVYQTLRETLDKQTLWFFPCISMGCSPLMCMRSSYQSNSIISRYLFLTTVRPNLLSTTEIKPRSIFAKKLFLIGKSTKNNFLIGKSNKKSFFDCEIDNKSLFDGVISKSNFLIWK